MPASIQFSPANTSPDFTTYDDNGLYFRTAPSDLLQGRVLANLILDDGNESVSILYRQESYGIGLAESLQENFEANGGTVDEFLAYAVDTESFDAEVDALVEAGSDAIVVIGFAETRQHPDHDERAWHRPDQRHRGVRRRRQHRHRRRARRSVDPRPGSRAPSRRSTSATISDFTARLDENGAGGEYAYGAETYDSIIITALAAAVAGSDDPSAIAAEINGVTKDGEKCTTLRGVHRARRRRHDIDYDGFGGPYDFVDAGEPAAASFRIWVYDGADAPEPASSTPTCSPAEHLNDLNT